MSTETACIGTIPTRLDGVGSENASATEDNAKDPVFPPEVFVNIAAFLSYAYRATLLNLSLSSRGMYFLLASDLVRAATTSYLDLCKAFPCLKSFGRGFPFDRASRIHARALNSLFLDSQNVGKLNLVKDLEFPMQHELVAASLLQRCQRLEKLEIRIVDRRVLDCLASAVCATGLTDLSLNLTRFEGRRKFCGKSARLSFPQLSKLRLEGSSEGIMLVLKALDRGRSISKLYSLSLKCEEPYEKAGPGGLCITQDDLETDFKDLRYLALHGKIKAETLISLQDGLFGSLLEKLSLNLRSLGGPDEEPLANRLAVIPLPNDLEYRFCSLVELQLGGSFHSTLMDAFSQPTGLPKLARIALRFTIPSDIGPGSLRDYTFTDRVASVVSTVSIVRITSGNGAPWSLFEKLAGHPDFRPTALEDTSFLDWGYFRTPIMTSELWSSLCSMDSLQKLKGIWAGTRSILEFGLPRNARSLELCLICSGLTPDDAQTVADLLLKRNAKIIKVEMAWETEDVAVSGSRVERDWWQELKRKKGVYDRLFRVENQADDVAEPSVRADLSDDDEEEEEEEPENADDDDDDEDEFLDWDDGGQNVGEPVGEN